jgi:hypothetical protein
MNRKALMLAAAAVGVLSACASPLKEPRPVSFQQSLESASHWNQMANTTAEKVLTGLSQVADMDAGQILGDTQVSLGSRPIYVRPVDSGTPFAQAFTDLLIGKFLERGHTVATRPAGAVVVNYDVQVVPHERRDPSGYMPGDWTITSTAGYVLWEAADWSTRSGKAALLVGGPILDLITTTRHMLTDVPNTEVVVSTVVLDDHNYLLRTADVFYVNDADARLFLPSLRVRQTRLLATGSQVPAPTTSTRVQFVTE